MGVVNESSRPERQSFSGGIDTDSSASSRVDEVEHIASFSSGVIQSFFELGHSALPIVISDIF